MVAILNLVELHELRRLLTRQAELTVLIPTLPVLIDCWDFVETCTAWGLGDGLLAECYPITTLLRGYQECKDFFTFSSIIFKFLGQTAVPSRSSLVLTRWSASRNCWFDILWGLSLCSYCFSGLELGLTRSQVEDLVPFSFLRICCTVLWFIWIRELCDLIWTGFNLLVVLHKKLRKIKLLTLNRNAEFNIE